MLKQFFSLKPHLAALVDPYITKKSITIDNILHCNPNLTFIAILQGSADKSLNLKPIFYKEKENDWQRLDETEADIMVTKDTLNYLTREFNFQIKSISSIFFYKKSNTFNFIFQNLIQQRAAPDITACRKQLLKKVVNYSTGFFGFNQNKPGQSTHKIVSKLNKRYDIFRNKLTILDQIENKDYMVKTTYKIPSRALKPCLSPLPIYCFIVEYGKMKMSQILTFFDHFLDESSYRHLYSNVDNLIFALATDNIDQAVKPRFQDWYEIEKSFIFSDHEPGHLKQEFYFGKETKWKFVSPRMQSFSIIAENLPSIHKSSLFKHVSSLESYNYSLRLLNREPITLDQPRRVNKIVNTKMHQQTFVIKPNK